MSDRDIAKLLRERSTAWPEDGAIRSLLIEAASEIERLRKLDQEAATYVELLVCLQTDFSGEPPYVGWKGIGLKIREVINERDRYQAALWDIAHGDPNNISTPLGPLHAAGIRLQWDIDAKIAREALGESTGDAP